MKIVHYDHIQILKSITYIRWLNGVKLYVSFWISRLVKRPVVWGEPLSFSVEPTTSCNLRCSECPSGLRQFSRDTGMLSLEVYQAVLEQLSKKAIYLNLYFQGEPYLHPSFFELVKRARHKGLYVATSTNAHYLSPENALKTVESGLNRLIISMDGDTQEIYQQYRVGGKLEKVVAGIQQLVQAKKSCNTRHPWIILQCLVVKPNEHQLESIQQKALAWGVNEVRFKTAQVYEFENGHPLIPVQEKYSRYKRLHNGKYVLKNKLYNHCWRMWQGAVFTWDGKVVPCCFDKDARYRMGDLQKQSFKHIWTSKGYQQFRKQLLRNRKQIDICKNCSEGTQVWS